MDALEKRARELEAERFGPTARRTPEQLREAERVAGLARQRELYAESLAYDQGHRDENRRVPLRAVS